MALRAGWYVEQGIQLLVAVGTIAVAIVAVRKPPTGKLEARLLSEEGETTRVGSAPGRFFHIRVANPRRRSPVREVRVVLLHMLDNVNPERSWRGPAPMAWRHAAHWPQSRVVGPAADADLVKVVNHRLHVLSAFPSQSGTFTFEPPVDLTLFLQAQGLETNSDYVGVRVVWDGDAPAAVQPQPITASDIRQYL
jgi:hypothetical protein